MKIKFIMSQKGFSLIQGMVIAGVLAGSGLVATRLMQDQKLAAKGAETRDQIEQLHDIIYSTLQSKEHCTATMAGNGLTGSFTAGASFPLPDVRTSAGTVQAAVHNNNPANVYINGNVIVKSMQVAYTATPDTDSVATLTIVYERLNTGDANKRTKSGLGAKEIKKTVALRVQRDPNAGYSSFIACYALTNAKDGNSSEDGNDLSQQFCNELNGGSTTQGLFVWDAKASMCKPKQNTCPSGQIYTGIDSNGVLKCRNIADWYDLGSALDPTPPATCGVGKTVRFTFDNSFTPPKVKIICY